MKTKNLKQNKGFTIIESLVAITILVIAVTGPLALASKGLAYSNYVKDEITAFYLANEAMDVIRNIRDTNLKKISNGNLTPDEWSKDESSKLSSTCGGNGCRLSVWQNPLELKKTFNSNPTDFFLKKRTYDGNRVIYSHDFDDNVAGGSCSTNCTEETSSFSRKIVIEELGSLSEEIRITVTVSWMSGSISREVVITENLFKLQ